MNVVVRWSYLVNLTLIGNAIYVSMDVPDTFLAVSILRLYPKTNSSRIFLAVQIVQLHPMG